MGKTAKKEYFNMKGLTRTAIKNYIKSNYTSITLDDNTLENIRKAFNITTDLAYVPNKHGKTDLYHIIYGICYASYTRDDSVTNAKFIVTNNKPNYEGVEQPEVFDNFGAVEDYAKGLKKSKRVPKEIRVLAIY